MMGQERPVFVTVFDPNGKRQVVPLTGEVSVGRAEDNDILLDDPRASRHHCKFATKAGRTRIVDLSSTHGTLVNGERITERDLEDDDEIRIGNYVFLMGMHSSLRQVVVAEQKTGGLPKWLWVAAAAVVLAVVAGGAVAYVNSAGLTLPKVAVVKATSEVSPLKVPLTGRLETDKTVQVKSGVNGKADAVLVQRSAQVALDDPLVTLDAVFREDLLKKGRARVAELQEQNKKRGTTKNWQAQYQKDKKAYEQTKIMRNVKKQGRPLASAKDLADAQRRVNLSLLRYKGALAREKEARELKAEVEKLQDASIRAPIAGRVLSVLVAKGAEIEADDAVAEMAPEDSFRFVASFPLSSEFLPGDGVTANIVFPETPPVAVSGILRHLDNGEISIALQPPLPASLDTNKAIMKLRALPQIMVPREAVIPPPEEWAQKRYVWVAEPEGSGNKAVLKKRKVLTSEPTGGKVPVLEGLEPDDLIVVVEDSTTLADWQKVRIQLPE